MAFRFNLRGTGASADDDREGAVATMTTVPLAGVAGAAQPARAEAAGAAEPAATATNARRLSIHLSRGALPRLTMLLLITAQLADLATFGLAVRTHGIADEVGPLRMVYLVGGFGGVALAKLAALGVMIAILEIYSRRTGHGRWLAILVAAMGVFGALTNILALV